MILVLIAAAFLLGALLAGLYAGIRITGHLWRQKLDEQTVMYEQRIAETERNVDEKILKYERQAMQLGAAVLAEKARVREMPASLRVVEGGNDQ